MADFSSLTSLYFSMEETDYLNADKQIVHQTCFLNLSVVLTHYIKFQRCAKHAWEVQNRSWQNPFCLAAALSVATGSGL